MKDYTVIYLLMAYSLGFLTSAILGKYCIDGVIKAFDAILNREKR